MGQIELTKGYQAIVDDDLFEELNRYNWFALDAHPRHTYAGRWIAGSSPRKLLRMHHVVLKVTPEYLKANGLIVDHKDRNGLHNTKENLRITTRSINAINSDHHDKTEWIRWDCYRERFKVVTVTGAFIKWCKTIEEAVEVRNAHHINR